MGKKEKKRWLSITSMLSLCEECVHSQLPKKLLILKTRCLSIDSNAAQWGFVGKKKNRKIGEVKLIFFNFSLYMLSLWR